MTVFDRIDPERITIRGLWDTRQVWVNDVLLQSGENDNDRPRRFTWGDTSHGRGNPRQIQNLAIAIAECLDKRRGMMTFDHQTHYLVVESDEIAWINTILSLLQRQDFTLKLNMRTRTVLEYDGIMTG